MAGSRVTLRAVLFDVDFTLVKPGPDLGPDGYAALGRRFGLELDPERHAEARAAAVEAVERHPELDHDEEVWVLFTERIIRGMGGDSERAYEAAVEMTRAWENAANFELYEDTLPVLAALREHGLKIGLVSNTGRDLEAFVSHHALDVDAAVGSGAHGKSKPHPAIFLAAWTRWTWGRGGGDGRGLAGGRHRRGAALGMRAFLVDREGRFPEAVDRLPDLLALPAALGLAADPLSGRE